MKKFLFILLTGLMSLFIACNDTSKTTVSSTTTKNLEASRAISKAFQTGDASIIDSVVASDFVDHTDRGDMGRDSLKAMVVMVHREFPDQKTEVIKEFTDDDHVVTVVRYTGTSKGQMGMPVGPYDMHAIHLGKFKDGKLIEHWEYMEMRDMMKMMGQMGGAPMDTTKAKNK